MIYHRGLLVIALLLAFGLRIWGLSFGLPYEFHPDENYYIEPVLTWLLGGPLDFGFISPPLFTYVLSFGYWVWLGLSPYAPTGQWLTAAWTFARFWSVIFSVLTVALAYPLGKRLYGDRAGILAAVILSGLFLPVREAHFAVNDAAVAFFVLLAVYASVFLFWRRRWQDFTVAGIAVGLAASAKLTGGLVVLALLTAYLLSSWPRPAFSALKSVVRINALKYLVLGGLAAGAVFSLISFRFLIKLPEFFGTLVKHLQYGAEGYKGLQMATSAGWHFYVDVFGWGLGWSLLLFIGGAIGLVVWRRYRPGLVLVIFSILFFGYMGGQKIVFARFILPIVAPLVILAAGEVSRLIALLRMAPRVKNLALTGLTVLLLAQPLSAAIRFDYLITLPDTRLEATEWLLNEFFEDTVIVKESYAVFPKTVFLNKRWPSRTIQLNERGPARNDPDYFVTHKTDLIVTSNFISGRRRADKAEEAARLAQQAELVQKAELIKTFNPYRIEPEATRWFYLDEIYGPAGELFSRKQPGPLLKIYHLPYENQPHTFQLPPIPAPVQANFANKIKLVGYDLSVSRADPGGAIPLTLYWQALDRMDQNYVVFNHLLDSRQRNWGGYDRWPQETAKTSLWHPGEIVVDTFNVPVAPDAPDGVYSLDLGLYNQEDLQARPLLLWQNTHPLDQTSVRLGPIKIGGPPPGVVVDAPAPQNPRQVDFGDTIRLHGYNLAQTDQHLSLTFFWESLARTDIDYTVFVHLRNQAGETVAQKDQPPTAGAYPTSLWDAGEIINDEIIVPLDEALPSGSYDLALGVYDLKTGQRLAGPDPDSAALLQSVMIE